MRIKYPSDFTDKTMVRFPPGLHARIKSHAAANNRSLNKEIITALEAAYPAPVEPEAVNQALLEAAEKVMNTWADVLSALGQDPDTNAPMQELRERIERAAKEGGTA